MSVLVEALSLVVPRKVLDISYPGGTEAFLQRMMEPDIPMRRGVSDEHLVSIAFYNPEDADKAVTILVDLGVVAVSDDAFYEFAFVDQQHGPTMPCSWLEFRRHRKGFSYCWLPGTDPTELRVPDGWEPEQSSSLVRQDIRKIPGRAFKLSEEDGIETWLDLQTGRVIDGLSDSDTPGNTSSGGELSPDVDAGPAPAAATEVVIDPDLEKMIGELMAEMGGPDPEKKRPARKGGGLFDLVPDAPAGDSGDPAGALDGDVSGDGIGDDDDDDADYERFCNPRKENGKLRLTEIFCGMLDGEAIEHRRVAEEAVRLTALDDDGPLEMLVSSNDDHDYIEIVALYAPWVPAERRPAVCEAICRLNRSIVRTGHFEIDMSNGEMRYRHSLDVEELGFTHAAAEHLLRHATAIATAHRATLMKVAFGGMGPGEVG
jgi:hypothetical protein